MRWISGGAYATQHREPGKRYCHEGATHYSHGPLCTSKKGRPTCEDGLEAWALATRDRKEWARWKGGFLQARAWVLSDSTMKQIMTSGVVVGRELQAVHFYLSHILSRNVICHREYLPQPKYLVVILGWSFFSVFSLTFHPSHSVGKYTCEFSMVSYKSCIAFQK